MPRAAVSGAVPQLVDDAPSSPTYGDLSVHVTSDGGLDLLRSSEIVVKSLGPLLAPLGLDQLARACRKRTP